MLSSGRVTVACACAGGASVTAPTALPPVSLPTTATPLCALSYPSYLRGLHANAFHCRIISLVRQPVWLGCLPVPPACRVLALTKCLD